MRRPSYSLDFSHLSPPERILLAQDLWDSITPDQDAPPLAPEQQDELQRRLADADRGAITYFPWQAVKRRLLHPK